jgi:Rod binding domain-containing protein
MAGDPGIGLPVGAALALADADGGRIEALRRAAGGDARRVVAAELQVLFLSQLLGAMRRTIPESDFLPRSPARSVYEGIFDRSIASALAAGDPLGLVRLLGGDPALKSSGPSADKPVGSQGARKP